MIQDSKSIKLDKLYMDIALRVGLMSNDNKHKVGAIIVDKDKKNILSFGWNGTPSGTSNETRNKDGITRREVIHAETNAICKLATSTRSSSQAILYTTISPCFECARYIIQAGIEEIIYKEVYEWESILFLKHVGIKVRKLEE